jgi:hypothetical protein
MTAPETDQSGLERRYRRLLAFWYPWEHRRQYEAEMLAVVMAGTRPGQRWPSARDTANLIGHGLSARLGASGSRLTAAVWLDAVAVMALLSALVLLAQRVSRVMEHAVLPGPPQPPAQALRALGWAAVVAAVLAGWRVLAAAFAWITVTAETVLFLDYYQDAPVSAIATLVPLALGILAAVALTVPTARRRAVAVLGWPRVAVFVLALATFHAVYLHNGRARSGLYETGQPFYAWFGLESSSNAGLYLLLGLVAAAGLAALVAVATLRRPVRWRIAALIAPMAVLAVIVERGLAGWASSNANMGHPIYLVTIQWAVLVAAPLSTLVVGAAVVHRLEHVRHMVALGEATDGARPVSDG